MQLLRAVSLLLLAAGVAAAPSTAAPATYYIDDADPVIDWGTPNQFAHLDASFAPVTWLETSECYNETITYGWGYSDLKRSFTVPFTGTGIVLYVVYDDRLALNVTTTLDHDYETINWFIWASNYTTETSFTSYNATLYAIQGLAWGDHSVTVELQDYQNTYSTLLFDYALVTGTRPSANSSAAKKRLGAGLGGGLGAVAVLGAAALIFLFVRRRRLHRRPGVALGDDPFADPADGKDPSLFSKARSAIRPGHSRRQSSFSHSGASPISPVSPAYAKYLGGGNAQKHPWLPLGEQ
ncbi:hypothetical protein HWV62_34225 [Athelia sp. TMB]|nr:hypothetical protein HWV62_34225 [Athelia sp. TMB]